MEGATANAVVGSLSQTYSFMVFFPLRSELLAPTRLTLDHPLPHLSNAAYMCVFYFYPYPFSSVLSLTLLTHLNHSYLLLPHLTFHDSESAYSFYIYLPPIFIY